jgi:hypothetical protein
MKTVSILLGALVLCAFVPAPAVAQDPAPAAQEAKPAVVYVAGCCHYSKSLDHFWEGRHPANYACCWSSCHSHHRCYSSCYSSCYHGHGCCGGGSLIWFHLF